MSDQEQESREEDAPPVEANARRASTAAARKRVAEEQDALSDAEVEQPAEDLAAVAARADEILDRAGERAGARVGQVIRSGERAGQFLRSGADQVKQFRTREHAEGDSPTDEFPAEEESPEAVARAEVLMDRAGERVGQLLRFSGQQVHRTTALAREAIEDFVAEAESIRRGNRSGPD